MNEKVIELTKDYVKQIFLKFSSEEQKELFASLLDDPNFRHNLECCLKLYKQEKGDSIFELEYNELEEIFDESLFDFILTQNRSREEGLFKEFQDKYKYAFINAISLKNLYERKHLDDNEKIIKTFISYILKVKKYFPPETGKKDFYLQKALRFMSKHSTIMMLKTNYLNLCKDNADLNFTTYVYQEDTQKFVRLNYILRWQDKLSWTVEHQSAGINNILGRISITSKEKNNAEIHFKLIQKAYSKIIEKADCYLCGESKNDNARCENCEQLLDELAKLLIISKARNIITDKQTQKDSLRKIAKEKRSKEARIDYFNKKLNEAVDRICSKKIEADINARKQEISAKILAFRERVFFVK